MHPSKFFALTGLGIFLITLIKLIFFQQLNIDSIYVVYIMWLAIAIVTIAFTRRFGVINYLEALVIIVTWVGASLFFDVIFLTPFTTFVIYYRWYFWVTYPVMALAVFLFHKKRHVEIRRSKQAIK